MENRNRFGWCVESHKDYRKYFGFAGWGILALTFFALAACAPLRGTQEWPKTGMGEFCTGNETLEEGIAVYKEATALERTDTHLVNNKEALKLRGLRDKTQCIFYRLAEKGDANGRYFFALTLLEPYSRGNGTAFRHPANSDQIAQDNLKRAALQGHGPAFLRSLQIREQKLNGYNEWIKEATNAGNHEAQYELGMAHLDSRSHPGIPRDAKEGEKWLLRSAEQGNQFAAGDLGSLYEDGAIGVDVDNKKAIKWWETLLDKPEAKRNGMIKSRPYSGLARLYCGVGEMDKALEMTKLAYNFGEAEAKHRLANSCKQPGALLKK